MGVVTLGVSLSDMTASGESEKDKRNFRHLSGLSKVISPGTQPRLKSDWLADESAPLRENTPSVTTLHITAAPAMIQGSSH